MSRIQAGASGCGFRVGAEIVTDFRAVLFRGFEFRVIFLIVFCFPGSVKRFRAAGFIGPFFFALAVGWLGVGVIISVAVC